MNLKTLSKINEILNDVQINDGEALNAIRLQMSSWDIFMKEQVYNK